MQCARSSGKFLIPTVASLMLLIGGCAHSGATFSELRSSIPEVKADYGRIYFYRQRGFLQSSHFASGTEARVSLDGRLVIQSRAGEFFFVDSLPASVDVRVVPGGNLVFELKAGETRYVRLSESESYVLPELVDNVTAEKEIQKTTYTGPLDYLNLSHADRDLAECKREAGRASMVYSGTPGGLPAADLFLITADFLRRLVQTDAIFAACMSSRAR